MRVHEAGQSMVMLLAFVSVAITLTTAVTMVTIANATATSVYTRGEEALSIAEAGIDNAMLRLLRDPAYTGETLAVGDGAATITVSGTSTKTITSVGQSGTFRRTVVATATYSGNVLTLTSWTETP